MTSFYARMLLDIQERISTEVPEIKYIEQNFGQYSNPETRTTVSFPAMLVDFPDTDYSELSELAQMGEPTINIILLFSPYSQSYNLAPLAVREKALDYYEIEHKVFMALHGWNNDTCQPLVRKSEKGHNRNEFGLRIREMNFTTEFEDYSMSEKTTKTVKLSFTGEIS